MRITTTATSKGQITIPKSVRLKLGIKQGTRVDVLVAKDSFVGRVRRAERIGRFAGDLKSMDAGDPLSAIRLRAQANRAEMLVKKLLNIHPGHQTKEVGTNLFLIRFL